MTIPHRFAIGDLVELRARYAVDKTAKGTFTVERLLPNETSDREYRIRNRADGHERVVLESSLIGLTPLPALAISR